MGLEWLDVLSKNNELQPTSYTNANSKWMQELNFKSIKILEENIMWLWVS